MVVGLPVPGHRGFGVPVTGCCGHAELDGEVSVAVGRRPCRRGAGRAGAVKGGEPEADGEDVGGVEVGDAELVEPVEADPELGAIACEADPLGEGGGVPAGAAGGGVAGEGVGEHGGGRAEDGQPPVDVVAVGAVHAGRGVGADVEDGRADGRWRSVGERCCHVVPFGEVSAPVPR